MNLTKSCRFLLTVVALVFAASAWATNLSGIVRDEAGEALPEAAVRLLRADSTYVSGTTTNNKGHYRFNGLKAGKYILEVSYIGYAKQFVDVKLGDSNLKMDPVTLTEEASLLREVEVVGVRTPIKVMDDTIEFNAGTFKTQPNAVVEDLLKRLPGVEVGSDGKITVNGKEVSKILVDGKEFFSDDPTVASKNLPAEMVDRLQVVDRKSDLARMTGVDDGEDETVINLSVKKGMKNGWFGNAEVGYGTDDRYQGSFMVNRFQNGNQLTFLGNFNNVNNLGFSDGGSRFRRFGGANGITTAQSFGMNFNVGNETTFRAGGDVMYSHTDRKQTSRSDRQYLFTDSTSFSNTGKYSRDRGHNIRGDFRIKWDPNENNSLEVRPNFSLNFNRSNSTDSTLTNAGDALRSLVSRSFNENTSKGNSFEAGLRVIYNHKFASHPGRSFSVMANYQYSNVREKGDSYALNRFYLLNDSTDIYDQYDDNHTWSHNASTRLSWTEPLGDVSKGNFLTFSYNVRYRWNDADKLTYDHPVEFAPDGTPIIDDSRLVFNDSLSNRFRNDYFTQQIRLGYKHVTKTVQLDAGLALVPQMSKSEDLINSARNIPTRWVWNFAPFLRYKYKMGKQRSLDLNYNGRSSQPSMTQLQPVADYSDPMRVVVGNPDLDPSFSHNARIRFQDFNADAQRSIMLMGNVQYTQNSIVSKTTFNPTTGGQVTTYENVDGVWSARLWNMFSMPFKNHRQWQFNNSIFLNFNRNVGFNNGERNTSMNYMVGESFSIAWRPDNFELELRPFYNFQTTHNSLAVAANRNVHTYGGRFNGTYITPFGVTINTDLNYSATSGYSQGYDSNQWMWNAQISYQFLRGKNATIAVKAYDILQQRESIRRNVTANYIEDTESNVLGRYVMATFTYTFNTFGKGNEPQMDQRGPNGFGGPGPGGRPPRY